MQVFWRVTFSDQTLSLTNDGVDLGEELGRTSGSTLCRRGDVICTLTLEIQHDEVGDPRATLKSHFSKRDVNFCVFLTLFAREQQRRVPLLVL